MLGKLIWIMEKIKKNLSKAYEDKYNFLFILFVYIILGAAILPYYQYQVNSDGLSYISIARKYARLDITDAVNGFWGPLFSWLLAPLLVLKVQPLLAAKVIALLLGAFGLKGVKMLTYKFALREQLRYVIIWGSVPIMLYFAFSVVAPDLLLVVILLYYLNIIFSSSYHTKIINGALCGLLGGVAYLAKPYGLPFFLVHFFILNVLHFFQTADPHYRKNILKNAFLGFAIFFVVSGTWATLISLKYQKFTFGNSGTYNFSVVAPGLQGDPLERSGLLFPSDSSALSAWDDPTFVPVVPWSPLKSLQAFFYEIKIILKNAYKVLYVIFPRFSLISFVILVIYLLWSINLFLKRKIEGHVFYPLITILIYIAGYVLVHVEERYLWIVYMLLFISGAQAISIFFQYNLFSETQKRFAIAVFLLLFIMLPTAKLASTGNTGKDIFVLAKNLQTHGIRGKIASYNDWVGSLYLSYYLQGEYYGVSKKENGGKGIMQNIKDELSAHNIDYYFVWKKEDEKLDFSKYFKEIATDNNSNIKVYSVNENL